MKYKILKKLLGQGFTKGDLRNGVIRNASLYGEDLSNINIENVILDNSNLRKANLKSTIIRGACLENVDLSYANLENASLEYVNLSCANIENTNLQNTNLHHVDIRYVIDTKPIMQLATEFYHVIIFAEFISIGCECRKIFDWENMYDYEIDKLDLRAIEFWKKYKNIIFEMIKLRG